MSRNRRGRTSRPATSPTLPALTTVAGHSPAEIENAAPGFYNQSAGASQYTQTLARMARTNPNSFQPTDDPVAFGPGVPAQVTPLDDTGEPRQWEYPLAWNLPGLPGRGRPLSMETLRSLAAVYDIMRKCIDVRKDEFCSLRFSVISRETDRRKARQVITSQQGKINQIESFFMFPDRKRTWQSWLRLVLEDYFVLDAVSIWKHRDYGGKLIGLRVLDGALIKPMLAISGDAPEPPDTAYQQYVWGVARWNFTSEELIYAPKNVRPNSPYGMSPVEQFLTHITTALRHQRFVLDYFTDGTIPEGVAEAPASWNPKQIQDFNAIWDRMLAGDSRALHKLRFVPAGFKFHQFKEHTFDPTFARWLVGVTCAAFDIQPIELGFEPMHGGLGGTGFSEEQSIILRRKAIVPLMRWLLDEIINPIIWEEFGATNLQGTFIESGSDEAQHQQMQARDLAIRNGSMSIDEAIEEDGGTPIGIGRIFVAGQNVYGEPDLIALSKVGAMALNVKGTPEPEGSRQLTAGETAAEQASTKTGQDALDAHGKPKPATPAPPTPSPAKPAFPESKKAKVPPGVFTDPVEALKDAAIQVQTNHKNDNSQPSGVKPVNAAAARESDTGITGRRAAASLVGVHPDIAKAALEEELARYSRFARARQKEGKWRPFRSELLPDDLLNVLNTPSP